MSSNDPAKPQPVEENEYRADLALLQSYQRFSSEILRLSLLGVAVLGFLIKDAPESGKDRGVLYFVAASALTFVASAAFALVHRYLSSDGFFYHLRAARRHSQLPEDLRWKEDAGKRNRIFQRSGRYLAIASVFLGLSALLLVLGMSRFVWLLVHEAHASS